MARGEGDVAGVKSQFVERVTRLPLVHVVCDYALNTYSHIKESNRLVNFTLTNAEKTANFVAGQAKPVVLKFEKQIQAVDDLACKGLGTLEEKVPFIRKPADEIIGDTRKLYTNTVNTSFEDIKKYGNTTVKTAADFGIRQASAVLGRNLVHTILTSFDDVLLTTHTYIDHMLPPLQEETQSNGTAKEDKEKRSTLSRLHQYSHTVRGRAYRTLMLRLESAQERSLDLLLTYPIRAIEISKENLEAAIAYANRLWLAITQQKVDEAEDADKSHTEQQLLHLARLLSKQVATAYSSLAPYVPGTTTDGQEPIPAALLTVRGGAIWVMGMVKLIPQLLPMYIYGLVSWLEDVRNEQKMNGDVTTPKENGSIPNNHSHSNNVQPDNAVTHDCTNSSDDCSDDHSSNDECPSTEPIED